ncbi:co-chaperone GroES [Leuconostocaceae bacterium ESL0958]|nr:co-chaperone GroES [Leuconostocaceae bacterium ESL0958]
MLKPLADRVIVSVKKQEETVGGIVLAANSQDKPKTGEVVAVGPGALAADGLTAVEPAVSVGDQILFDQFAGQEVDYQGETYLALHEADIIAVV